MPVGLEVRNASNQVIFSPTYGAGKILGVVTAVSGVNGSVVDPKFTLGTPFWFATPVEFNRNGSILLSMSSSNTLSWTWQPTADTNVVVVYGVG